MAVLRLYRELLAKHGAQGWWPVKSRYHPDNFEIPMDESEMLEIIIGAILTQNTSWKNVEKALNNLYAAMSQMQVSSTKAKSFPDSHQADKGDVPQIYAFRRAPARGRMPAHILYTFVFNKIAGNVSLRSRQRGFEAANPNKVRFGTEPVYAKDLPGIEKILNIKQDELAELIRPAGYFNQKARKLKAIAEFLKENSISKLKELEPIKLRNLLLSIWGIGPETADSIVLYAFKKPVFVVDAYTRRLMKKNKIIKNEKMDYHELQALITKSLQGKIKEKEKVKVFNEFHALIVKEGKMLRKIFKNKNH